MFEKIETNFIFAYGKTAYPHAIQTAQRCFFFKLDSDEDELVTSTVQNSCYNCLYRKWTQDSFICMKKSAHEK